MLSTIEPMLSPTYFSGDFLARASRTFCDQGYVRLPKLFEAKSFEHLRRAAMELESDRTYRNFTMPVYNTPRHMHTIGGTAIRQRSPFLMSLYESCELRTLLMSLSGSGVYPCLHRSEFMVINFLESFGSTHGWHLDDPALALVIVLQAPPATNGGLLEYVPDWHGYGANACYHDAAGPTALVEALRASGRVQTAHHEAGDAFLLRADQCLHRVTPLSQLTRRRVVLNLSFENTSLPRRETADDTAALLYD